MDKKDNLLSVIATLFKWKKTILYTCGIAAIGSIVISLLLTTYYQSTTVFFAASPDLAKPEHIAGTSAKDMDYYGNENDIDRILTLAESNEVIDHLIQKFNLYKHYDIDSTTVKAADKIRKAFLKLYNVTKTKRDAIELSIEDEDPVLAAQIANEARHKIDQIGRNLIKQSLAKLINTTKNSMLQKEVSLTELGNTLRKARSTYHIVSSFAASEALATLSISSQSRLTQTASRLNFLRENPRVPKDTIIMLEAKVKGMQVSIDSLNKRMERFTEGMSVVDVLAEQHHEANEQLGKDKERFKQLEAAYNSDVSAIILVEEGKVPVVKSRPARSLIVIAAVFIAFILSIIAVLLLDTYKEVDWKKITKGEY